MEQGLQGIFCGKGDAESVHFEDFAGGGLGRRLPSLTELMMSEACGFSGSDIMFSSNDTPAQDFQYAAKLHATINLDDFTHIDF